ncbi:MAG: Ldh family oxidoreductase [Gemmataceae bacterium]|nr:Ldh family oxidoreductase [Gemmataceae bacterium]MCS7271947.1 Ldh family oxidoreductase [Gemmataceae bacterium]MDW8242363.1 Ldh family oxidoreductase [Thermogemmata sp.]
MPVFSADTLRQLCQVIFQAAGVPPAEADVVARSLVQANLCGHDSHGVLRVPQYVTSLRQGVYRPGVPLDVIHETPALLAADGNWGLGQVQAYRLLERLTAKADALGVAAGTLRHCGHVGRLGEYAEWAAERHLALIAAVNSHGAGRRVAPPGGTQGRISTNPICIGVPTTTAPIILDFSTSAAAEGKVRACYQKNQPCPEGWLIDHRGQPTTDPSVLYTEPRGALLPFGGSQAYKGFGLGLVIDLLCGGLSGGPCSGPDFPINGAGNTALFIVLQPRHFAGLEHFLNQTDALTAYVRTCPTAPGVAAIALPGDPERQTRQIRLRDGIPIPEGTWQLIEQTARELQVPWPVVSCHTPTH